MRQEEIRGKEFSVIELVAKRREYLAEKKTEVGSMASNFLEVPHERVNVLEKLVKMVPSSAGSNKDNKGMYICINGSCLLCRKKITTYIT